MTFNFWISPALAVDLTFTTIFRDVPVAPAARFWIWYVAVNDGLRHASCWTKYVTTKPFVASRPSRVIVSIASPSFWMET